MIAALEELREVMKDPEVQRVLAGARAHPERPTAARLLRIVRAVEVVLGQAGEEEKA